MMLKSNFGNREKLVPTQIPTGTFEFKFGMQRGRRTFSTSRFKVVFAIWKGCELTMFFPRLNFTEFLHCCHKTSMFLSFFYRTKSTKHFKH